MSSLLSRKIRETGFSFESYDFFLSVLVEKARQNVAYFICFAYLCNAKGNLWLCFVIPFVARFVACGVCSFYGLCNIIRL